MQINVQSWLHVAPEEHDDNLILPFPGICLICSGWHEAAENIHAHCFGSVLILCVVVDIRMQRRSLQGFTTSGINYFQGFVIHIMKIYATNVGDTKREKENGKRQI